MGAGSATTDYMAYQYKYDTIHGMGKEKAQSIIDGGAKKVIYSAPAKDDSQTIVMGVNVEEYDGSDNFISCASCTTNGLAPMVKAVHDEFDIQEALMTTVHAMTATQAVVDSSSRKAGVEGVLPLVISFPHPQELRRL